ncbi:MAG: hypothetical protein AB1626_02120 [Candidatus Micrarchaeota archaeon]
MTSERTEDKAAEKLAKEFDYSPAVLKELCEFMRAMHEFTHYLQENRYYSEALNKKVFELTLELESIALKMNLLRLRDEALYGEVEKAVLRKEKPKAKREEVEKLKKEIAETQNAAEKLYSRLQGILGEILAEYRQKNA